MVGVVTLLDDLGRDRQCLVYTQALRDWLSQKRIGEMAQRRGVLSQSGLVLIWSVMREYATAPTTLPVEMKDAQEGLIRGAMRRLLSDYPTRRRIAAYLCGGDTRKRRNVMAEMLRWHAELDERANSLILRAN
jgi:hypothetical protein